MSRTLNPIVDSSGDNVSDRRYRLELIAVELANDLHLLVAELGLDQLVAFLGHNGLNSLAVHSRLLELFADLELDLRCLDGSTGLNGVDITIFGHFDHRRRSLGQVAQDKVHS